MKKRSKVLDLTWGTEIRSFIMYLGSVFMFMYYYVTLILYTFNETRNRYDIGLEDDDVSLRQ